MQRFFLPTFTPELDEVVSLAPIHKQLRRVLRVQPGSQIIVLDNQGHQRLMDVVTVDRRDATARVVEIRPAPPEPVVPITFYLAILKSDKLEWVLQKATELGATQFVPVITKRTVARPGRSIDAKQARWEAIVREAAEQSERGALPVVAPVCSFEEAIHQAKGVRLLPWEEAQGDPGLLAALGQGTQPIDEVSILIGPEGGLDASEVQAAIAAGWQVVSLGARILRAETAALASMAVVTAALGGLGDAPSIKAATPASDDDKKADARKRSRKKVDDSPIDVTQEAHVDEPLPKDSRPEAGSVGSTTSA